MILNFLILIFFDNPLSVLSANNQSFPVSVEYQLITHLLKKYDADARPILNPNDTVPVQFDIALKQLLQVTEREQKLTLSLWMRQYWEDPLLQWDPKDWNGVKMLSINPSRIWKPDITLYNNAEREFQGLDEFGKLRINVQFDGKCAWLFPAIMKAECRMDLTFFPFDVQHCPLTFGSWIWDEGGVNLTNRFPVGDVSAFQENSEFLIGELNLERKSRSYRCCPNPFVTIVFHLNVIRRAKFYFFNLLIPGLLIALLSCFSFFLPPLCGERTGLVITNFLSLSVYILMISGEVPPSSRIPLLVTFYTALIIEIGVALCINCIIIPLAARNTPMPEYIKKIFLVKLAKYLGCQRDEDKIKNQADDEASTDEPNDNKSLNYPTFYQHNEAKRNELLGMEIDRLKDNRQGLNSANEFMKNILHNNKNIEDRKSDNSEILKVLKNIYNILEEESNGKRNNGDWEQLTTVLDRLFFIVFALSLFGSMGILMNRADEITL